MKTGAKECAQTSRHIAPNLMPAPQVFRQLDRKRLFEVTDMDNIVEALLPGAQGTAVDSERVRTAIQLLNTKFAKT
jgi:hypothetical protein